MKNRIYEALNEIKAEEELKQSTYAFLQQKVYKKKKTTARRLAIAFACIAVICFTGLFSHNLYFTETAFIDIDVNPSIELTLNRFDRIIGVYAYNDDGKKVLDEVNIQHKSYSDALETLIYKIIELGYIDDDGLFSATLQMNNTGNEEELLDAIKSYIDTVLQSDNVSTEQDVFIVDSSTKAHSHEQNLSPAKYLSILELQAFDTSATFDRCRDNTINEIRQQTHNHMNGNHGNSGNEHGQENGAAEYHETGNSYGSSGNGHSDSEAENNNHNTGHGNMMH